MSITDQNPAVRIEALKQSRLSELIQDKGLFPRIQEAALHLLNSEDLRKCTPESIMGSLYKAVTLGFRLEPEFKEVFLIPRFVKVGVDAQKKEVRAWMCSLQIGYNGWKAMALQTGFVEFIEARPVYEGDLFDYEYGTGQYLKHKGQDKSLEMTHFYVKFTLSSGKEIFHVINKAEAERSRKFSESQYVKYGTYPNQTKVYSDEPIGFWKNGYATMALRGPIKTVCSWLPLTPKVETAMMEDGAITIVPNEGEVRVMGPNEVMSAEDAEHEEVKAGEHQEAFLTIQDELSRIETVPELVVRLEQFKETPGANVQILVELFVKRADTIVKTENELTGFFKSLPEIWQKNAQLRGIVAQTHKRITNGIATPVQN